MSIKLSMRRLVVVLAAVTVGLLYMAGPSYADDAAPGAPAKQTEKSKAPTKDSKSSGDGESTSDREGRNAGGPAQGNSSAGKQFGAGDEPRGNGSAGGEKSDDSAGSDAPVETGKPSENAKSGDRADGETPAGEQSGNATQSPIPPGDAVPTPSPTDAPTPSPTDAPTPSPTDGETGCISADFVDVTPWWDGSTWWAWYECIGWVPVDGCDLPTHCPSPTPTNKATKSPKPKVATVNDKATAPRTTGGLADTGGPAAFLIIGAGLVVAATGAILISRRKS